MTYNESVTVSSTPPYYEPNPSDSGTIRTVGTGASPISDAGEARPDTDQPVYWLMANGVTPTNAEDGDIIWNASA